MTLTKPPIASHAKTGAAAVQRAPKSKGTASFEIAEAPMNNGAQIAHTSVVDDNRTCFNRSSSRWLSAKVGVIIPFIGAPATS